MDAEEFFAVGWPELVPRLRAMLARAGAPSADRDDLVQETALRLFRMWDSVDPDRPVEPLARRIALNAWRDQWRRRGEREVLGDVPELATGVDTERAAMARVQVGEVSRALSSLPVGTAQVLRLAAAEMECGETAGPTTGAVRMARTRARRALLACLKVASAVVAAAVAGIRSWSRPATTASAVGSLVAFACVLALTLPGIGNAPALQREGSPLSTAASGPGLTHGTTDSTGKRPTAKTGAGSHRRTRPAPAKTPYYVVGAGPAEVAVFADINVYGHGVRVAKPEPGNQHPLCGYGDTPITLLTPGCSQP